MGLWGEGMGLGGWAKCEKEGREVRYGDGLGVRIARRFERMWRMMEKYFVGTSAWIGPFMSRWVDFGWSYV